MNHPEMQDVFLISPHEMAGKKLSIPVGAEDKLRDLADTYFRHVDQDYGYDELGITCVKAVYQQLINLEPVSPDTEGAQWVIQKKDTYVTVLPEQDIESMLAKVIHSHFKKDPLDDNNPDSEYASLALGMGIDFMLWLNKQLPALLSKQEMEAKQKNAEEKILEKMPKIPETAAYFVMTNSAAPEEIFFSSIEAYKSKKEFMYIFGKNGKYIDIFFIKIDQKTGDYCYSEAV